MQAPARAEAERSRLELVFTLDYEIHGNGEGSPLELMVGPTARLLDLLERFGAKLTIMADVPEILKFREHRDSSGGGEWGYDAIERQLRDAVARGHDVQLHLHPSYSRARFQDGKWVLDYGDYDLARLGYPRIAALVKEGKGYLEGLLQPIRPSYRCRAFRAANWSMCPSADIVRALGESGFAIDTSVFKYGRRDELVRFDYASADSEIVPWPIDPADVCRRDESGEVFEFPIYCESRPIWAFLSANRFYRVIQGWIHPLPDASPGGAAGDRARPPRGGLPSRLLEKAGILFQRHAWKLDFNQCSGRQMIAAVERARSRHGGRGLTLPLVLIGHSKLFNRFNEGQLRPFLEHVASRPDRFGFATFDSFDVSSYRGALQRAAGRAEG